MSKVRVSNSSASPSGEPNEGTGKMSELLYAAQPVSWRGEGELIQVPWRAETEGLYLVVDLWSGIGGLLNALLALGVRFVAATAEVDVKAASVTSRCFPNAVHYDKVEQVQAVHFAALLERRKVRAYAPCP